MGEYFCIPWESFYLSTSFLEGTFSLIGFTAAHWCQKFVCIFYQAQCPHSRWTDQYYVVYISAQLWMAVKVNTHTGTWNGKKQLVNNTSCIITQICLLFLWNKTYLLLRYNLENEKVMVHNNIYSHIESYQYLNWNHMKVRKGKCFLDTIFSAQNLDHSSME